MDASLARELLAAARERDGRRLALRCAGFLVATTRVAPHVVPRRLRERAIASFTWRLFEGQLWQPHVALAYAGLPRGHLSP
jgi:hypothetical protein